MSRTGSNVVVVGAGAAGHTAASTLRKQGYTGGITLVHPEPHAPYNRSLVNKAVMQGLLTPEEIALANVDALGVDLVHAAVVAIDTEASLLVLDNGERLSYTALVATTGSTPRARNVHAAGSSRLLHVHTVPDALRIRAALADNPGAATVTLLGAGFIGAETASYLAEVGATVNLVSRSAVPLARALGGEIARRVAELHNAHVRAYFGRAVVEISAGPDSVTVTLDDGELLESDLAVAAYGTVPASAWATGADEGIAVDDRLRAVDLPGGYAAGNVAVHTSREGQRYRIDHWDAAATQGAHAARTFLYDTAGGEDPGPYAPTSGFRLNLYRHAIAAYGVVLPAATERQHAAGSGDAILTTFHGPGHEPAMTAAAGLGAARELLSLRHQLERP